jgi:hypothetical protein
LKSSISIDVNFFILVLSVKISLPNKIMGRDNVLYIFMLEIFWLKFV